MTKPADMDATVASMLRGVPLPAGFRPVLREMNADGDHPEVLWEIAAGVNGRNPSFFDGKPPTRETWDQGLGCTEAPMSTNVTP